MTVAANQPLVKAVLGSLGAAFGAKVGLAETDVTAWVETSTPIVVAGLGSLLAWFRTIGPETHDREVDKAKRDTRREMFTATGDADTVSVSTDSVDGELVEGIL